MNASVFLSFYFSVGSPALSPYRSTPGPLSVLSSLSISLYSQLAPPPFIVVFASALDGPPSRPKFSYSSVTPHLMAFLKGPHDL